MRRFSYLARRALRLRFLAWVSLLAAAPAAAAPTFPLRFEGRSCDSYARCQDLRVELFEDGLLVEHLSGMTGTWTWDPVSQTFVAHIDDLIRSVLTAERVPGEPCVRGPWTSDRPEVYGVFRMCRV